MNKFTSTKSVIRNVKFGKNCKIIEPVNLYECELGENVFVGPFVEITVGVKIGFNTKIQSHSFICNLVTIGNHCFIGHGVMFINDLFKSGEVADGVKKKWFKTKIGNKVLIGSNSTILPVNICDGVLIGAGSVVTKDIKKKRIYAGNPVKLIRLL
jgi:acetyltransferase-like isoleucine patch superfamily enzyme